MGFGVVALADESSKQYEDPTRIFQGPLFQCILAAWGILSQPRQSCKVAVARFHASKKTNPGTPFRMATEREQLKEPS